MTHQLRHSFARCSSGTLWRSISQHHHPHANLSSSVETLSPTPHRVVGVRVEAPRAAQQPGEQAAIVRRRARNRQPRLLGPHQQLRRQPARPLQLGRLQRQGT